MRGGPPGADASGSQCVVFVGLRFSDDAGTSDDELSGGDAAEGFGVGFAFGGEDAAGEAIGRVIFQDGDDALEEDGAVVVLVVGQMNGAARDAGTASDHRLVDVVTVEAMSGEGRDEGRMNVQHAVAKVFWNFEEGEEPGEGDEVDAQGAEPGEDRGREGGDIGEGLAGDDFTRDGGVGGALDAATVGTAGDDEGDVDGQASGGAFLDEVEEGRAAAGDEHGNAQGAVGGNGEGSGRHGLGQSENRRGCGVPATTHVVTN